MYDTLNKAIESLSLLPCRGSLKNIIISTEGTIYFNWRERCYKYDYNQIRVSEIRNNLTVITDAAILIEYILISYK